MTEQQLIALGTSLTAFLRTFQECFVSRPTIEHLHSYCRGLLSDLPRKSVEPIALACGSAVRTLQEFLADHLWDHDHLRDLLQQRLAARLSAVSLPGSSGSELGTIGVIDETSTAKKGTKTPGVARQYCGASGKIDNCLVTVHLAVVQGRFQTLVDAALFLPQAWSDDRARCRAAKIPDELTYRPKWRIALEEVARAAANGLPLDWLTFDEYYGGKPGFLLGLDALGRRYIGEVPRSFRCFASRPRRRPRRSGGPGRRPRPGWVGSRADDVVRGSSTWRRTEPRPLSLRRLTVADQHWEVRSGQVHLATAGAPTARRYWLIFARNTATAEEKYFVSNAAADESLERLLQAAFCRWHVEHSFRVAKSEIGFGHFEGRSYVALMRHQILCLAAMNFAAEQTARLRGEKPGELRDHIGTGLPRVESAVPRVASQSPGNKRTAACRGRDQVSSTTKPSRAARPSASAAAPSNVAL